ncbi:hypothetical protein ACROYT_G016942 [Oculina patagonica]
MAKLLIKSERYPQRNVSGIRISTASVDFKACLPRSQHYWTQKDHLEEITAHWPMSLVLSGVNTNDKFAEFFILHGSSHAVRSECKMASQQSQLQVQNVDSTDVGSYLFVKHL